MVPAGAECAEQAVSSRRRPAAILPSAGRQILTFSQRRAPSQMRRMTVLALALAAPLLTACASLVPGGGSGPGYGAVAYSSGTGDWRIVSNASTTAAAARQAQDACGPACAIVLRFGPGQCGTLALNAAGAHAYATGSTVESAENTARSRCQSTGGTCRVAPAQCNRGT